MSATEIIYAFDAYCGWCYGFSPTIARFAEDNAGRIAPQVLSGGLFTGTRARPISDFPHIPDANKRISALTGVTFGEPYERLVAEGGAVMDSTHPALGLIALRNQAPDQVLAFTGEIQQAWYRDGRSLGDVEVYTDIAVAHGLDPDRVAADFASPATRSEAQRDFETVRRLGVSEFPTLLLTTPDGVRRIGGVRSTHEQLTAALTTSARAAA